MPHVYQEFRTEAKKHLEVLLAQQFGNRTVYFNPKWDTRDSSWPVPHYLTFSGPKQVLSGIRCIIFEESYSQILHPTTARKVVHRILGKPQFVVLDVKVVAVLEYMQNGSFKYSRQRFRMQENRMRRTIASQKFICLPFVRQKRF
jgi:hypothetical protein